MQGKTTYLELNGTTKTMNEWCKHYGTNPSTVRGRIKRGADPLTALTAEKGNVLPKTPKQKTADQKEICMKCKYRNYIEHLRNKNGVYCEYMYHTGHRRPCPANGCVAFVEGPMLPLRSEMFIAHERGWNG